jgi:hypothetical protein
MKVAGYVVEEVWSSEFLCVPESQITTKGTPSDGAQSHAAISGARDQEW